MSPDIVELGMDVDGRPLKFTREEMSRFVKEGKRVDGAAKGVTKSTNIMAMGMKRAALAIGATVAAMASLGGGIRTIAQFEQQMSTVGAVSRATTDELDAMRAVAADLGSTTEFTAKQAGEGLEFLARAGFSARESVEAIPSVLDLATAAAMGLGRAADVSSNIMSAFGIEAANAASVADILAAASSRANTDVQQLGDAMSFVGPVASALGIEMSDTAAAIGVLSDAGIQGSTAGTGLRRVLSSLANPTKDATVTLKALGVAVEEVNPQTNSLTEIVDRLAESGITAAEALTIFGDRGGPAILALTSQTGRLRELTGELTNVEGEAKRMADTMRDNLGGDIDSLVSSVQGLILALGDAGLTAVLRGVVQLATGITRSVTAMVNIFTAGAGAVGQFVAKVLGLSGDTDHLQAAIDNVTLAMGDQIAQMNVLESVQGGGRVMTLEAAQATLGRAMAERELLEAMRERAKLEFRENSGFRELMGQADSLRTQLKNVKDDYQRLNAMTSALGDGTTAYEVAIENVEQELARVLGQIEKIKVQERERGFLSDEQASKLAKLVDLESEITAGIESAKDGMVRLGGETQTGVELTNRLSAAAGSVSFKAAEADARRLVEQLGIGLELAMRMAALGPQTNPPQGGRGGDPRDFGGGFSDWQSRDAIAFLENWKPPSAGGGGGGALKEMTEAARQAQQILSQVNRESVTYADIVNELTTALNAGAISQDQFNQALEIASGKYDEIDRKAQDWSRNMSGHFDGLITGGKKFSDVLMGIARQLESSAWQQLFSGLGGGLFGGGGGGAKKGLLGLGGFLGFLDSGGNIGAGQWAVAGERRPELVTGPTLVRGPASVVGGAETARMMRGGGQGGGVARVEVAISVDEDGNIIPIIRRESGNVVAQAIPQAVSTSVKEVDRQMRKSKSFGGR